MIALVLAIAFYFIIKILEEWRIQDKKIKENKE